MCADIHSLVILLTVVQSHTGLYMAWILKDVLLEMGIEGKASVTMGTVWWLLTTHKIIAITMDNATSCNTLATELATLLPGQFAGLQGHIQCVAHIVNLALRRAMSVFDTTEVEMKQAVADIGAELGPLGEDLTDVTVEINLIELDHVGCDLAGTLEGMMEEEAVQVQDDVAPLRDTVQKVRT